MSSPFNQPLGGNEMPRFGGPGTMMRLPSWPRGQPLDDSLDVGFVGVALDIGTSHRPGARFGPKAIRAESSLLRPHNMLTRAAPFEHLQVADLGDVAINTFDLQKSLEIIESFYDELLLHEITPLTLGGDHTIVLPILRALSRHYGPVGVVHIDAHSDVNESMFGEVYTHGTPFRRAVEESLLDTARVVQIGIRGSGYGDDDLAWPRSQGFRIITADECWGQSLVPLMSEIRSMMGTGPTYISFDIDGLDPAFAPGTGTPEIAGLTTPQALQIIQGCRGLNVVGGDVVEVSPAYDTSGNTALTAANLLFEMLCVLPGVPQ